jgi:hypothetical protein
MTPKARQDELLSTEVGDELVIYDQRSRRAHRLNRTTALIWRYCDGEHTVEDIAALLAVELDLPADQDVVWFALRRLERCRLLEGRLTPPTARMTRAQIVRKLGLAGGLALAVPVVQSLTAPTAAIAAPEHCHCQDPGIPTKPPNPCKSEDSPVTKSGTNGACVTACGNNAGNACHYDYTWTCGPDKKWHFAAKKLVGCR